MRRMRAPVLDVPVDGVAGDTELRLDLGAVGRPGPLHGWSLLSDDIAEEGGGRAGLSACSITSQITR